MERTMPVTLSRPRRGHDLLFGRTVPAVAFALLGCFNAQRLASAIDRLGPHPSASSVLAGPVSLGIYCVFVCIPGLIYIARPPTRTRDGTLAPRILAFAGTTMLLIFGAFFGGGPILVHIPLWAHNLVTVLLIAAESFAVWGLLHLRTSFSLVPQARRLVRGGPYGLVRHPLYFGEIAIAVSLLFQQGLAVWSTLMVGLFVAVQYGRSHYEERLLRRAFPTYIEYVAHTPRLIPFFG
jgi:protein-S-isoprenylcysteine O-methyltransferase Ste14